MKPNKAPESRQQRSVERALSQVLADMDDASDIYNFLIDLCTPAELQAIADRWQVALLLREGMPYRAISEKTAVSVTTIGRVARCITHGSGGYTAAFEQS
ncbi:MAG: YerC/YecD family TrpR-related protein [Pseudomonadota bacterium]